MSKFLFLLFNVLVFLSFVLHDIPFGIRRPLIALMALISVGLSVVGVFIVLGKKNQIGKWSIASWQSILVVLVLVPLVRTPVSFVPLEMKMLLFTGLVALLSSYIMQGEGEGRYYPNIFYGTISALWLCLLIQGFLGESDTEEVAKTGLYGSGLNLSFSYVGVFESANHFAILFGFISTLLLSWLNNLYGRLGVAIIATYVLIALDANIALASFLIIFLFQRVLFRYRWLFVVTTIFFPVIFGLFSAVIFALFGVESDLLVSMNNRLPMWGGLLNELQSWSLASHALGRGWYSNYSESTLWIYQSIFGQFYSGLKTAHSTSLQIFMDTGGLGFAVWFAFIQRNLCRVRVGFRGMRQYFGPLAFVLLTGISESLIGAYMPSFLMLVCVFIFLIGTNKLSNCES